MNVRIAKISGGNAMRTNTMVGELARLPEVGEAPVIVNGKPLDDPNANMRVFNTSPVASYLDTDEGRQFTTESGSVYLLTIAAEEE